MTIERHDSYNTNKKSVKDTNKVADLEKKLNNYKLNNMINVRKMLKKSRKI